MTSAELVARSVCYLYRWRIDRAAIEGAVSRMHGDRCRFCDIPLEELRPTLREKPDDLATFVALDRKARYARIREASEGSWWEGLPSG